MCVSLHQQVSHLDPNATFITNWDETNYSWGRGASEYSIWSFLLHTEALLPCENTTYIRPNNATTACTLLYTPVHSVHGNYLSTLLHHHSHGHWHRKIRLIEGNAKCLHLKKSTCKGTLRQVFICLRSPPLLGYCLGWCSNIVGSDT